MIGTITATQLNVRALPNLNSRKLGELSKGTVIEILNERNGWFELLYQGTTAFISGDYVDLLEKPPRQIGITTASLLNVRDRPSVNSVVLGTLAAGSLIEVLSQQEEWLEISYQQGSAFISRNYVEMHEQGNRQRGVVTASLLNVRSQPEQNASIIGQLPENTEIVIESTIGNWCEIPFNKTKGYVSARYVRNLFDTDVPPSISIAMNQHEEEEEVPPPVVTRELTEEGADLSPANQFPISGTSEERKVAKTWNQYGGLLSRLSEQKSIDVACTVAVLCVESSGKGFDSSNQDRMIIRFENHKFWKYWGRNDPDRFREHFRYSSGQVWKGHKWRKKADDDWQTFHGSQRAEWEVLNFARSIDNDAALMSISMGAPQIMGFHYQAIGYQSVQEMFDAFASGIEAHISGLFDFMSPAMARHLQRRDFTSFAGLYNGSGQKEKYGRWIKNHYDAFKRLA